MSNELAITPSLAPSTMEQALAFAEQMSLAQLIPQHLQKRPADCLRVVLQAARWQMDPFSVADKTSIISGKLMYEGQLVSAVVNARGNLSSRLNYTFKGEGDARVLTVSGTIRGEETPRVIELPFSLAKRINKNGQMAINPDQQATYIGARIWARRHMPELMLGVYTPDEMDDDLPEQNVTGSAEPPKRDPAPERAPSGVAASKKPKEKKPENIVEGEIVPNKEPEKQAEKPQPKEARTALNGGERITAICRIINVKVDNVKTAEGEFPTVIAEVDGEFKGKVYHYKGAESLDRIPPAWNAPEVSLVLYGKALSPKKNPDGTTTPRPCAIMVESINEYVAPTSPAAQGTGSELE